ncbi:hypothetical protein VPNG_07618 [Cytospora leucostoma]|uniref:Uncharacterized protein n=1 Tax=Cytospora leucostoma TaxID=1230097 RepID=A0A423WDQ8_9PEZI|nr:hypothetical protein VPNG_07618 [Cytospora leucostoma]
MDFMPSSRNDDTDDMRDVTVWGFIFINGAPLPGSRSRQARGDEHVLGSGSKQRPNGLDFNLASFWKYYIRECEYAIHDGGRHIALRTQQDVVEVAAQLEAGLTRTEIKEDLRRKLTSPHDNEDELLEDSINLVSNLLLMMGCGIFSHGFSGRTEIMWTQGSLRQHLVDYFGQPPVLGHERVKREKNFTARNLGRIAGLEIVWTDNLADHLRMSDDNTKVHIFHHASFLECQRRTSESLLPDGVATETLQTLALLLPSYDTETRKWFNTTTDLDTEAIECGQLRDDRRQIETFTVWRDRLVMLKQVFDEAQPRTMSQWWHDRRNRVQWYTFWVAILVLVLTIIFGLIQSVEGALQVYISFKSMTASG